MRIKTEDYEQAAFTMVSNCIKSIMKIKVQGLKHARCTVDYAMEFCPAKWEDENTAGIGWTKHNESKLRKFVDLEIRRVKAGARNY